MSQGWAVFQGGEIDLRTAGPTRRSAIINWLVVAAACPIMAGTSDAEIEALWQRYAPRGNARVIEVNVTPARPATEAAIARGDFDAIEG